MHKPRRRRQKTELKERESQKEITTGLSGADIREILEMEYGSGVVSLTITTPPTLLAKVMADVTLSKVNRSLAISYLLHQGLARYKEKFELDREDKV